MKVILLRSLPALLLAIPAVSLIPSPASAEEVELDGSPALLQLVDLPARASSEGGGTVDIVGDASNPATGTGRAKGNAYRVDIDVVLTQAEFWLNFNNTQTLTYYYDAGDSQATSFGAHVHGHATGYDPLPSSFDSMVDDQAIYYQRLTTGGASPAERSTWGDIKSLFR